MGTLWVLMGALHIRPLHAMVLWPESPSDLCYSCAPLMVLHCYIDGVALLHWWCWRIFEIAQSAIKCVFNVANLPWTIQSQHDQSFMFEFEIQEGDSNVCISLTTCKSSLWEFVSFSEQSRLSRSDSTWGDKTEGSTLFSREGSRRACR